MSAGIFSGEQTKKRTAFVTAAIGSLAVVTYMFAIQPLEEEMAKNAGKLEELKEELHKVETDLKNEPKVMSQLDEIKKEYNRHQGRLLTPLLGSWAMRAKAALDPIAKTVGVRVSDYAEGPARALPLPKPTAPKQLYARRPIKVSCRGDYGQIVSFVMRVEELLPHVAVQSVRITAEQAVETQLGEVVLEWPAKGAMAGAEAKGGKK